MKVLYVGQLWEGSTCAMRMTALEQLGHEVTAIDASVDTPQPRGVARLYRRVAWRLGWPIDHGLVNERLVALAAVVQPDVIWIDKGLVVSRAILQQLRTLRGSTVLVHYNPDDPFGGFGIVGWRTFLQAIPHYDVHIVPRRVNVEEYCGRGARRVFQALPAWGYATQIHQPMDVEPAFAQRYQCDVGFVGSFEEERALDMAALAQGGAKLRIVGPWPERLLTGNILHSPEQVFGIDYVRALRSFKIALGFLRKKNRDQHTSRSIEIPACGVFMLAERSDEHRELFEEGEEAEFFSSTAELIEKTAFYLRHDRAREKIAKAGRLRCLRSRYDNMGCMERLLRQALQQESG